MFGGLIFARHLLLITGVVVWFSMVQHISQRSSQMFGAFKSILLFALGPGVLGVVLLSPPD